MGDFQESLNKQNSEPSERQPDSLQDNLPADHTSISQSENTKFESGLSSTNRLSTSEIETGKRLEQQIGIPLKEGPHVGEEYIDELGKTYDAIGGINASKYWNERKFLRSIDSHLLKSNDFTVIDLTGFSEVQIDAVRKHLGKLSKQQLAKIIRIGF